MTAKPDTLGLLAALERSIEQARELWPDPTPIPDPCLCGSTDIRGRILSEPVDLRGDGDVTCAPNEGQRPCRACQHGIPHGAMCVQRHFERTTTVRDHYHASCVLI